ncbi:hypothetical protein FC093_10770 [Ilyomonas limi]|uniref:Uncharacterized protein n=1 Tax=Ilyomonas limi TaxID=2575867 RepID=A0A4U3L4N1_9BACT|nr:hypothetical protein [Ilyomonas limi]TKK68596.1 hypothetical protein FC093_10770 [Ilyomonas limi]
MNQFWKYTLIITGANVLFILLCFAVQEMFVVWFFGLIIQLLLGIGMVFPKETRTLGQAFLLSFAIVLVIGFSVCSIAWNSSGFH